jgi:ankyrin repeat protein
MDSVTLNDTRVLEILIRSGADVNAGNNEGETPLMIAALKGNPDNVKLLLNAGANINARDQRGETPLKHAMERNHSEVIEMLKSAGAKE